MTFDDDPDAEKQSGTSEESEQVLMALERISASCSPLPMTASAFGALSGSSNMGENFMKSRLNFLNIFYVCDKKQSVSQFILGAKSCLKGLLALQ